MAVPGTDEVKMLGEALSTVKLQVQQMKRYLDMDQMMDALKSASTMLAELRTSSLTPKQYYELYMSVFDALRHLTNYLHESHVQGRHHLADLYELVQYAGNIVPRLYLMITVGSVFMSIPEAPVKEIMRDMMEMARGVQHPMRGLFLRHYLSGQTRDCLPIGDGDGPEGNLKDSISFVVTNFVEMNKLWVRMQHQGHSREREKRELERRELRILVGTNLVRLSQLDGVDLSMYQRTILPTFLEQVVNCKDVIAQEYLMEVIIQVFPDEFHLHSLSAFLSATAQLHPKVNIKQIVIALIDRLAAYAAREAESDDPEETKRQEEAAAKRLAEKVKSQKAMRTKTQVNGTHSTSSAPTKTSEWADASPVAEKLVDAWTSPNVTQTPTEEKALPSVKESSVSEQKQLEQPNGSVRKFRGIPEDVRLFEVFWQQVVELIRARPDLSIQDITALLVSLTNLSLSCYPDRLEYVDQVLAFAHDKVKEFANSPELHAQQTTNYLASLLLAPINSYQSVLTLLAVPHYSPLLALQPFATRRSLSHAVMASVLKNETIIEYPEDLTGIFDLCHVLIRDETDITPSPGPTTSGAPTPVQKDGRRQGPYFVDREELAEEQGWVARVVHLLRAESLDVQFELLQTARRYFELGKERMRFTFPALITASIKLVRQYKARADDDPEWQSKAENILKFARQLTAILGTQVEAPTIALRLSLLSAQIADECGFEDLTYDLYVQAFTVYEDSISDSRAQLQAITLIIGTLQTSSSVFTVDNYDTLITKATLHGAKLLKKSHQASAVNLASHMWWQDSLNGETVEERDGSKPEDKEKAVSVSETILDQTGDKIPAQYPHRDSKRVLECLQKSLRIANSATEEIVTVQLYCDTLDHYLYYYDRQANAVSSKFVNSLVELISSSIDGITSPEIHPSQRAPPGLLDGVQTPDMILRHFRNTLIHIQRRKAEGKWSEVDIVGASLKMGLQR